MRQRIEEFLLRMVRLYTSNTPIKKGKYRMFQTALAACAKPHTSLPLKLKDGRRFLVNLTIGMQDSVYFVGEYERVLTEISAKLIRPGDTCVDVGANFGWYTSLMAMMAGPDGNVHAFEPMPQSFAELEQNVALMGDRTNVSIQNLALGDRLDTVKIHLFPQLTSGHASLAVGAGAASTAFDCKMVPLDNYLQENEVENVDFVKVDIEGAELMFLKGARRLFEQRVPPIFLMEMAVASTAHFGYHPNDLIDHMRNLGAFEFFAADEIRGTLRAISRFGPEEIGANVFCIPRQLPADKREVINSYKIK